jgi:hypothetical protein
MNQPLVSDRGKYTGIIGVQFQSLQFQSLPPYGVSRRSLSLPIQHASESTSNCEEREGTL